MAILQCPSSLPLFLLCLPLFMAVYLVTTASSSTFSNETDRLALLAFKDRVSDPLRTLSSWNESLNFCNWHGVTCSTLHQRVTSLRLPGQSLAGSISPSIGNLTFLQNIILTNNSFYGEIPRETGRLFRLKILDLGNNLFRGEIPVNLSRCSQLRLINLNFNKLEGNIPMELSYLSNLSALFLHSNSLEGKIPPSFGNLSSLRGLGISSNKLEGNIPSDLGRLTFLGLLQLAENKLSGAIPTSLFNLSNLLFFAVTDNRLHGTLPQSLGQSLPKLKFVFMGINQLSGSIPVSLVNASNLKEICLPNNKITGSVPENFGSLKDLQILSFGANQLGAWGKDDLRFITSLLNCSYLRVLDIHSNRLGGLLPNVIANLSTQLEQLAMGENQFFGTITSGIQNLVNLMFLNLNSNLLTGYIPTGIGKLHKLVELRLSRNKFSGQIPSALGNLTQLNKLNLGENDLSGSIPSSLGSYQYLVVLNLGKNKLTGRIPKQVLSLSSLSVSLNLSQNALTGPLTDVGNLRNLQEFDLSFNNLSGEIPRSLGECSNLVHVRLKSNSFLGTIPDTLSALKGIEELDLSLNNLSGPIPQFIEKLQFLKILNLSSNNFEGEVPTEGVFKNATAVSVHGNKKLCGGISELQLPGCHSKRGLSFAVKIIISVSAGLLCLFFLLCLLARSKWTKKSEKGASKSLPNEKYSRVSYKDLSEATDGFSPANLIGTGSYGSVYKGILEQSQTVVAVKVLNLEQRGGPKSFFAECEALRNIRHRNLVRIITTCSGIDLKGSDFKALVFEYMGNGNLDQWIHPDRADEQNKKNKLTLIQRLNIAIDVASALDYLHHGCQTPIVHRDLKPSNILLDNDMVAHVADFGLAKFLHRIRMETTSVQGSCGYIAPEYASSRQVSTHGDVYSYGILLLEMFTGKRPTDDMFKDGLNLHEFAKKGLADQMLEIVDPHLLEEDQEAQNSTQGRSNKKNEIECMVSVIKVGLHCSTTSSRERMNMGDVISELQVTRQSFENHRAMTNTTH